MLADRSRTTIVSPLPASGTSAWVFGWREMLQRREHGAEHDEGKRQSHRGRPTRGTCKAWSVGKRDRAHAGRSRSTPSTSSVRESAVGAGARPREVVGGGRKLGTAARQEPREITDGCAAGRAPVGCGRRARARARASTHRIARRRVAAVHATEPPLPDRRRRWRGLRPRRRAVHRAVRAGAGSPAPAAWCRPRNGGEAALRSAAATRLETDSGTQAAWACSGAPVVRVTTARTAAGAMPRLAEAATQGSVRQAARSS